MEPVYLFDDTGVDIANGRYIVLGDGGAVVAQGDDFNAVVDAARAKGERHPAVVDLEMTRDFIHVY